MIPVALIFKSKKGGTKMKAVKVISFLAVMMIFLLAGGMSDVQAGFEGIYNTFYGQGAGTSTSGDNDYDTFIGRYAGFNNTTGLRNTFLGYGAGYSNATGSNNIFLGDYAGFNNYTGYSNTFLGRAAGISNYTGYYNTFIGNEAGYSNVSGEGNVFIGYRAGNTETGSNKLYIANDSSTPLIYGEFNNNMLQINGKLNVVNSNSGLVELADNTTNAADKGARMVVSHYNNAEEPVYLFGSASTATDNYVALGGGNVIGNAATQIDLFTASNNTTPVGTPRLTIKSDGKVGIGTQTPSYPLQMASGAYVTTGGAWTNASSREYKENISELSAEKAVEALNGLKPVEFNYKTDKEEKYVGFIAEDVPDLVATNDRKGLSPMDIVAVLTKVVKQQQKISEEQQKTIEEQQKIIANLAEKVTDLERDMRLKDTLAKSEYLP
jgi:hypothetical protein